MLPTKFQVSRLFISGKEGKNRFSRWQQWQPSWISDRIDYISFFVIIYKSPDASFQVQVSWPLSSGEEAKTRFSRWPHDRHLGFPIGTILAIFELQVTLMLSTKFWISWHFGSGEEAKNKFSRWPLWQPSWISDQTIFADFLSTSLFDAKFSYQVLSQLARECRRSRLSKQLLTPLAAWWTLTDHNSWPSALHAEVNYQ